MTRKPSFFLSAYYTRRNFMNALGCVTTLCAVTLPLCLPVTGYAQTSLKANIGVNMDTPFQGARDKPFVDLGKVFLPFRDSNGN